MAVSGPRRCCCKFSSPKEAQSCRISGALPWQGIFGMRNTWVSEVTSTSLLKESSTRQLLTKPQFLLMPHCPHHHFRVSSVAPHPLGPSQVQAKGLGQNLCRGQTRRGQNRGATRARTGSKSRAPQEGLWSPNFLATGTGTLMRI